MKKIITTVCIVATAMVTMASCTKSETLEVADQKPISLQVTTTGTRASETTTTSLQTSGFKLYAYNTSTTATAGGTLGTYSSTHINGVTASYTGGAWSFGNPYWPQSGNLQFFAVSDTSISLSRSSDTAYPSFSSYTVTGSHDLVAANAINQTQTTASGSVALAFRHLLTQVNFNAKCADPSLTYTISSVTVNGIYNKGSFTFNGVNTASTLPGTWTVSTGTTNTYTYTSLNATSNATGSADITLKNTTTPNSLMLLPQTLPTGANVTVNYKVKKGDVEVFNGTKSVSIAGTTWTAGSKLLYVLTLPVGAAPITVTLGSVEAWGAETEDDFAVTLSQFLANGSFQPEGDTWTIYDETATTADFANLKATLSAVYTANSARRISLVFPNLTTLPESAFYNGDTSGSFALGSISLPITTSIENSAFKWCSNLTTIEAPQLQSIGSYAFTLTGFTTLTLPATTVGDYAFSSTQGLQSLSLPNATTIGSNIVYDTVQYALTSLNLPKVTTISGPLDGLLAPGVYQQLTINIATEVESITSFAANLFKNFSAFSNITINSSVGTRGGSAAGAYTWTVNGTTYGSTTAGSGFKSVNLPYTYLSDFQSDGSFVPDGNTWTIGDVTATADDFDNLEATLNSSSVSVNSITLVFPNLTALPANAIYNANSICSVSLPKATSIGADALSHCGYLSQIYAPLVETVGDNAFFNISPNFTNLDLPSATTIGNSILGYCYDTTATVRIPKATKCGSIIAIELDSNTEITLYIGTELTSQSGVTYTINSYGIPYIYSAIGTAGGLTDGKYTTWTVNGTTMTGFTSVNIQTYSGQ